MHARSAHRTSLRPPCRSASVQLNRPRCVNLARASLRQFASHAPHRKLVYIVAGEASGDDLGAGVMKALKRNSEEKLTFAGIGGSQMRQEGLESLFPMGDLSHIGFTELIPHVFKLTKRLHDTVRDIAEKRPAVLVTIDSKGFSARLRKEVRNELGSAAPKLVHYVGSTSMWFNRNPALLRPYENLDSLLLLFPFERKFYPESFPCTVTGHPVIEDAGLSAPRLSDETACQMLGLPLVNTTLVGVFPGSRYMEVTRTLPDIGLALQALRSQLHGLHALVVTRDPVKADVQDVLFKEWQDIPFTLVDRAHATPFMKVCKAAVAVSGSVLLDVARCQVPMIALYKTSALTAQLVRWRYPGLTSVTLPNILLTDRENPLPVIPELVQENCNPIKIAEELLTLITDSDVRDEQVSTLPRLMRALSPPGGGKPTDIAARQILRLM